MKRKPSRQKTLELNVEHIKRRAACDIAGPLKTFESIAVFLAQWWCRHYGKPYKCEEVKDYTVEELLYEYWSLHFHNNRKELDKFLNRSGDVGKEDEKWLKNMMGEGYSTQDQQEQALQPIAEELEISSEEEDEDDVHVTF